jgi:hypothetical protein
VFEEEGEEAMVRLVFSDEKMYVGKITQIK